MFNSEFPPVPVLAKKQRKKWPWIAGGVVGGLLLIGVLNPSEEPANAEPVVTTVTATVKATPTTTTSAPPTTTLPPAETTVEPQPTIEAVVAEEDEVYVAPAPIVGQPDVDRPPVRQAVPEPVVQAPPPPPVPPTSAYYKNCTAVRAAGVAPIYRGDPGYSSKLDRDGDGVACE